MKITTQKGEPQGFRPVTLSITLESQAEVDALFHVASQGDYVARELVKKTVSFYGLPAMPTEGAISGALRPLYAVLKSLRSGAVS